LTATFDDEGRQITPSRSVRYDTLVIAIGSVTNDFGTPGVVQYAVPLETPSEAARFNRRLVNACIRAGAGGARATRPAAHSWAGREIAGEGSPSAAGCRSHG